MSTRRLGLTAALVLSGCGSPPLPDGGAGDVMADLASAGDGAVARVDAAPEDLPVADSAAPDDLSAGGDLAAREDLAVADSAEDDGLGARDAAPGGDLAVQCAPWVLPPATNLPGAWIGGITGDGWIITSGQGGVQAISLANGAVKNVAPPSKNVVYVVTSSTGAFLIDDMNLSIWTAATGTAALSDNRGVWFFESADGTAVAWSDAGHVEWLAQTNALLAPKRLGQTPGGYAGFYGHRLWDGGSFFDENTGAPLDLVPGVKIVALLSSDDSGQVLALLDDNRQVWVVPAGGKPIQVAQNHPRCVTLTPDGTALVMSDDVFVDEFMRLPVAGGPAVELVLGQFTFGQLKSAVDICPWLSPDGKWGLAAADQGGVGINWAVEVGSALLPGVKDAWQAAGGGRRSPSLVFTDDSAFAVVTWGEFPSIDGDPLDTRPGTTVVPTGGAPAWDLLAGAIEGVPVGGSRLVYFGDLGGVEGPLWLIDLAHPGCPSKLADSGGALYVTADRKTLAYNTQAGGVIQPLP